MIAFSFAFAVDSLSLKYTGDPLQSQRLCFLVLVLWLSSQKGTMRTSCGVYLPSSSCCAKPSMELQWYCCGQISFQFPKLWKRSLPHWSSLKEWEDFFAIPPCGSLLICQSHTTCMLVEGSCFQALISISAS